MLHVTYSYRIQTKYFISAEITLFLRGVQLALETIFDYLEKLNSRKQL